jgi:hypothetical protein
MASFHLLVFLVVRCQFWFPKTGFTLQTEVG